MTLLLSANDVDAALTGKEIFQAIEEIHADLSNGLAAQPANDSLGSADSDGRILPMTAISYRHNIAVVKLMADIPGNRERGLATQRSTIMVTSTITGECLAIIDGRIPTRLRTAAASAVATKHLARPLSTTLGLIGAGNLAVSHVAFLATVLPLRQIVVWSRNPATVNDFRQQVSHYDLPVVAADSPQAVFENADVVCTLTPSRLPLVKGDWFRPGQHINAVGAPPRSDHREIDSGGMARSRVVVDSRAITTQKSGDTIQSILDGTLTEAHFRTELGDVIAGHVKGRCDDEEITLFNSVGIGLQDLAIARLLIEHADQSSSARRIDLSH